MCERGEVTRAAKGRGKARLDDVGVAVERNGCTRDLMSGMQRVERE